MARWLISLSFLGEGSERVPTYFVDCEHGALPNNSEVIGGTLQLLAGGPCSLPEKPPKPRGLRKCGGPRGCSQTLVNFVRRNIFAGSETASAFTGRGRREVPVTDEEIRAEELVVRSFLATDEITQDRGAIDAFAAPLRAEAQPAAKAREDQNPACLRRESKRFRRAIRKLMQSLWDIIWASLRRTPNLRWIGRSAGPSGGPGADSKSAHYRAESPRSSLG